MTDNLQHIVSQFSICAPPIAIKPLGNGLINDTYVVRTLGADMPDYVLQRINTNVFTDVDMLQNNIVAVTEHIRKRLKAEGVTDTSRRTLTVVPTKQGGTYVRTDEGCWRMTVYIPRAFTTDTTDAAHSLSAGRAFGQFEAMLADMQPMPGETIPGFHDMRLRLRQLDEAVSADAAGRKASVTDLLDELARRAHDMCAAERLHDEGALPKRVCHCDTKVNNIMFDEATADVLCVIDLDTVMPSFVFSDYGDFLRSAANTGAEDDQCLDNVNFDMDIFKAFTRGYLETASAFLLPIETQMLPYAAARFPYMQCVRFLADYINGDTYYKTLYPEHNLVRTRAQLRLLQSVEAHTDEMRHYVAQCIDDMHKHGKN